MLNFYIFICDKSSVFFNAKERHNCRSRKSDQPPFSCFNGRRASSFTCTVKGRCGNKCFLFVS